MRRRGTTVVRRASKRWDVHKRSRLAVVCALGALLIPAAAVVSPANAAVPSVGAASASVAVSFTGPAGCYSDISAIQDVPFSVTNGAQAQGVRVTLEVPGTATLIDSQLSFSAGQTIASALVSVDIFSGWTYVLTATGAVGGTATASWTAPKICGSDYYYVSVGDSYSSGEGNAPFDAGTDVSGDKCHRSNLAWPRMMLVQNHLAVLWRRD